ncbi:MAG: polysaccharide deacetylase family protein [Chitinophagaceae bacterium]
MKYPIAIALIICFFPFCKQSKTKIAAAAPVEQPADKKEPAPQPLVVAGASTILARPQVPILCYHRLRDWKPNQSATTKVYIVPVANFREQIKMLADSGYHSITPDEYYAYLATGKALPSKPVMITFDDTIEEHYTVAAPELEKYGFKGVFFLMTVSIGRPGYMSREQVKELSDRGHVIASHTYDHHNVRNYTEADWDAQMLKPKQKLESIIGKPVEYFAYPFGEWKREAIPELEKRNYKAAFQLAGKRDSTGPLYTIRRMIVPAWDGRTMSKWMKHNF